MLFELNYDLDFHSSTFKCVAENVLDHHHFLCKSADVLQGRPAELPVGRPGTNEETFTQVKLDRQSKLKLTDWLTSN